MDAGSIITHAMCSLVWALLLHGQKLAIICNLAPDCSSSDIHNRCVFV